MGPALSPGAVGQEMAACAVLGGVLGATRAVLPTRGRAAFLPDMLFVGAVLMALQSYAVSQSQAGQRPVHRPVESCPRRRQSTAERKKTCKKTEKELANTTAYVV